MRIIFKPVQTEAANPASTVNELVFVAVVDQHGRPVPDAALTWLADGEHEALEIPLMPAEVRTGADMDSALRAMAIDGRPLGEVAESIRSEADASRHAARMQIAKVIGGDIFHGSDDGVGPATRHARVEALRKADAILALSRPHYSTLTPSPSRC
jgi:hypothetical protein